MIRIRVGNRQRGGRECGSAACQLQHCIEELGVRREMGDEDYAAGVPTTLQLAQQSLPPGNRKQPLLEACLSTQNSRRPERPIKSSPLSLAGARALGILYPGEHTVDFSGSEFRSLNSGRTVIMVGIIYIVVPKEDAESGLQKHGARLASCWPGGALDCLRGHMLPKACQPRTRLLVCVHLPVNSLVSFQGNKANISRANTHTCYQQGSSLASKKARFFQGKERLKEEEPGFSQGFSSC